ncbi:MAG: tetratricopeptide repeat protein [Ignavibacteria bacterium]|jgi:tetratricopeptide (TPR) repeat protein|nr:tetratricopeptide repeat protein [Ignavibacteria bacterium]MCU7503218.1 tetratricopeptide repeat protein [Ignavibacteria bacterium]MCU7518218.1 tetratricopeptide repeat protein [Ignavibacteria bacterium]
MLKNTIIIFGLAFLLFGCASDKLQKSNESGEADSVESLQSKEAIEHFIDGNIADAKGDYASAIVEYQDALRMDPKAGVYYSLAKDYLLTNKLSLALSNINNAVKLDSSNVDYYNVLAEVYSNGHQIDSAALAYEKIIKLDSGNVGAYYNLANIYQQSKPLQAMSLYQKLLTITGPEWSVLARIAELQERLGNTDESIKTIEQLLTLDPSNVEVRKLLIESYIKADKLDKAISSIDELEAKFPDDLTLREMKAQIYIQQEQWTKALDEYRVILDSPKVPMESKLKIGSIYLTQSMKDSTLLPLTRQVFEKLDKDSSNWQVKMVLGEIALRERKDSVAISEFKEVTSLARWNPDAWTRLGGLYFDNKKYEEAASVLNKAIKSFPDNFPINLILGLSLSQMNKYSEAKPFLEKAVYLNPNDLTALSAYGYTLNQLKESDSAVHYIKEALKLDSNNVDLIGTLGMIYNSQKKWDECDSAYSKALSLDPNNVLILNNYAYSLAERGIRLQEALKMAERAVSKEPGNSSYLDTYGWVFYRMGDYEKAEEFIRKALALDSSNSTLIEHLGDVNFKAGKKGKALEMWQQAYQLNTDNLELKTKIEKGEL